LYRQTAKWQHFGAFPRISTHFHDFHDNSPKSSLFSGFEPKPRQGRLEIINIPIGILMVLRGGPGRLEFHKIVPFSWIFVKFR